MGSEVLLYGYGMVCLAMLAFNIIYNISLKSRDRRLEHRSEMLARLVREQLDRLRDGQELSRGHMCYLGRKLSHVNNLIAFDRIVEEQLTGRERQEEAVTDYCRQLQPVILQLAMVYRDRENTQAAYFAYFLSRHRMNRFMSMDVLQDVMVDYMKKDSFYCKLNALNALYQFGHPENIVKAVALLDRSGGFFHEKVLTDGLLSYSGDQEELTSLLWKRYDRFGVRTKLAILNYVRFRSGDYCERFYQILTDPEEDKELRLSAIRYFGRHVYEPAKKNLLEFATDPDQTRWEYAAVSVTSLGAYGGKDVFDVLKDAMYSSNWYVRKNAAASLKRLGVNYSDMLEVMEGGDRYAREMMLYRLGVQRMDEERQGART